MQCINIEASQNEADLFNKQSNREKDETRTATTTNGIKENKLIEKMKVV